MAKPLTDILAPDALPTLPASPGILSDTLAPGPSFRPFADSTAMRRNIFNGVMTSVSKKYPLDNSRYSLSLAKLGYRNDMPFTLAEQKKAIMQGDSLEHQLEGEWVLTDKATGKIVDRKRSVVAHVPYATDRGTFIYRGNEYTISNQMRLKPGVFTRVKENGIIEAHFNVRPGTGPSFRVHMEPDTGIFRLNVGQSNLKLYPILKAMGVSDRELEKSWGAGLLQKNVLAEDPRAVQRAFMKLVSTRADMAVGDDSESVEKVAEHIGAKASDRKWRKLWFRGTIRAENGKDGKPWVHVEVHKGLCDAALDSLKQEGVNVERAPNPAHITLVRNEELKPLIDKYGSKWSGAAKNGTPVRFALSRIVHLVPSGWKEISRVWFIEVESPDLVKYRKDLGLPALPKAEDGTDHRFHITFAVSRPKAEVKHAFELLSEKRAAALTGEPQEKPQSAISIEGQQLLNVFGKMELDDDVTTSTLGEPFKNVGVPAILRTTRKLLNIQKGDEDIDDRDSLAYQTVHSPEDFFAERIEKDAGQIGRKMLWKATLRGNLKHVPSGVLTPQLQGVLLRSGMGMPLEEINPIDIFDQQLRVLRLGEGGIPSTQSIPDEARSVQPSHFGFVDPIRAPESEKIGVDARLAHGAYKGSDGRVYTDMLDARTGQRTPIPADLAAKSVVAFPGEMQKKGKTVRAMVGSRQVEYVDKGEVDYELISPSRMFTATSNLVPLISGIKGGRLLMGAKFIAQALPLKEPEAPLVQNLSDIQDRSFDDLYGRRVGAVHAESSGVVEAIDKNGIRVRYKDGTRTHELYDNFPFNRKTYVHNTPTVKIGDRVKTGDLLARSNFTDEAGTLAIGTNLRTAYMPYKGLNYEDAVVISEGAAKRLASEHMYQHNLDVAGGDTEIGRKQFVSIYPSKYTRDQLSTVNNEGAVKPGTIVKYGDPLVLALSRTKTRGVHRGHTPIFTDASLVWEHENEGIVTDVDKTKDGGLNVTVRAYLPAQEGDKLAGRFGDKGVISRVIPDDQMPQGADGKPYEILLNPLGVISRGNPSQIYETLLGKVARKRGQSLKVPSFMDENLIDYVKRELGRAGLTDVEDLVDPTNDSKVPAVLTGERFIMKLHHTAESKGRGRDIGGYTSEGLPARGGEFGSKRISNMEIGALLSHGATEVIRDAQVVRGQRNDDYWRAFRLGMTPPSPKVPLVYEKFLSYLQGAGINIRKDGNRLNLFALTDKDVDKLSSGAIENSQTVLGDTLSPVKGGLFDEHLTGGHGGTRWTHIKLSEPMPNPVMEEPIRRLLGMTQKQYEDVLSGRTELHGKVGGEAIKNALSQIRVDSSIEYYSGIIKDGPRSKRDNAVKVLGYLKTMQKHDLNPADFVLTKVPVLPPELRPITWFRGMSLTADPNFLYRDLIKLNEDLANMKGVVGNSQLARERLKVYDAFKAVTGFGDPVQAKTQEKGVRGLLQHVFGSTPKVGMFQRRVIGSPVDIVGRATITPNPDLSMDQVGIPEPKAWTIYRPFVMRRLVRRGMPATAAAKAVSDQDPVAKKALLEEMESRPVMINRAPTLHRYGFMAAWPVLTKGHTLQISPVITPGFAADFDGDAMNYHVPVTDEAVKDAIDRMLPSKNLHSVRDFQVHYLPKNEFLLGLYLASTSREKKEKRVFRNKADVLAAYQRGELRVGDPVSVKE